MSRRRAGRAAVLAGAVVLAGSVLPAGASAARSSFSGSCQLRGSAVFSPGVKFDVRQQSGRLDASGPCTGGQGHLVANVGGPVGCFGSTKISTGTGTLTVAGRDIPVKVNFDVKLPVGTLSLGGDVSGSATGGANFVDFANVMGMPRCPGQGLRNARFAASIRTSSPLVSGQDAPVAQPKPKKKKHSRKPGH